MTTRTVDDATVHEHSAFPFCPRCGKDTIDMEDEELDECTSCHLIYTVTNFG